MDKLAFLKFALMYKHDVSETDIRRAAPCSNEHNDDNNNNAYNKHDNADNNSERDRHQACRPVYLIVSRIYLSVSL